MTEKIPAGAKKPADRKKADDDETPEPIKVTVRGVEVTVDRDVLDDWLFIEDLAVADTGEYDSLLAGVRILRKLTGDKYRELRATVADENGKVTIEAGSEGLLPLIQEILEAANPNS